jgi:hypothetical protein
MKKIVLENGLELEVNEQCLNNMELLDALEEMTEGDELSMSKVVKLMLGKENRKKLYDSIRHKDGRVPLEDVDKCLTEIMMLLGEQGKNS